MNKSLARQMFIYFFVVILFSLSMVGFFTYLESSKAIDEQVEKYVTQVINNASVQTDHYMRNFERLSNSILSQRTVKRFLDMDPEDSYEYYRFTNEIRKEVFQKAFITYPTQINMIYILGYHGRSVFDGSQSVSMLGSDVPLRLQELVELTPDNGSIAIVNDSFLEKDAGKVVTVVRKIRGYSSYDVKGILAIEFNQQQLTDLWSQVDLGEQGYFFIIDSEGSLVYSPSRETVNQLLLTDIPKRVVFDGENRFIAKQGEEQMMVVSRKSDYSGWNMGVSLPVSELRAPIANIRITTITVGMVTLIVALVLATRFGNSIVRPIRHLREGMRQTEKGNWTRIEGVSRQDEIGGLVHSYNLMVSRLAEMINQVYNTELRNQRTQLKLQAIQLERQKAEFQALQLQINPHFMFNTLETINCYAIVQDSDEISEMVEALAFMLRYSVQTNLEEITIANELNHVRNYMIILRHRAQREFELEVLVPPELLLSKMVRLTLQPLVENVFQHAFKDGVEPHHYIRIDAREDDGRLHVIVEDNGAGMRPETLLKLKEQLQMNRLAETVQEHGSRPEPGRERRLEQSREPRLEPGREWQPEQEHERQSMPGREPRREPGQVQDHGSHRNHEKAESYAREEAPYRQGGIGVINVHRRIQMVFGDEYGLSVESELHRGTRMIMTMPAEKQE
ncbi:sensor histidine kinase [Paenibacillus senegalensis]|uniref:sensor histidine kinase n=1 Tax=Paenibacillus senegalensis TaxID=1465766 RepID=UPI00028A01A8|nr:histidine kinase [Paenibacillus senegalensis]